MPFRTKHLRVLIALVFCLLSLTGFAAFRADSVILFTPYPKVSVSPGQSVLFSIDIINNSREIITQDLSIRGLPKAWNYTITAGDYNIKKVSVLPAERRSIRLSVIVPLKVDKGSYRFRTIAGDISELPLSIEVSEQGTFKTEFISDQLNMEGSSSSIFAYKAILRNRTAEKQLYALMADVPPGWNVVFKNNTRQVTSVEVTESSTATINIELDPPDMVEAASYKIPVHAITNSTSADLLLEAVVKGSFSMELTTPAGLLSTGITAGDQKRIDLLLRNTGSAQLKGIQMSASSPVNWEVAFDPKKIDILEPGKTAQVSAVIKAARKAIAGDYVTNIEARTQEVSSKVQFRISVRTSVIWGWVGILIIISALGSVYYLFRKYGRR